MSDLEIAELVSKDGKSRKKRVIRNIGSNYNADDEMTTITAPIVYESGRVQEDKVTVYLYDMRSGWVLGLLMTSVALSTGSLFVSSILWSYMAAPRINWLMGATILYAFYYSIGFHYDNISLLNRNIKNCMDWNCGLSIVALLAVGINTVLQFIYLDCGTMTSLNANTGNISQPDLLTICQSQPYFISKVVNIIACTAVTLLFIAICFINWSWAEIVSNRIRISNKAKQFREDYNQYGKKEA